MTTPKCYLTANTITISISIFVVVELRNIHNATFRFEVFLGWKFIYWGAYYTQNAKEVKKASNFMPLIIIK